MFNKNDLEINVGYQLSVYDLKVIWFQLFSEIFISTMPSQHSDPSRSEAKISA